MNIIDETFKLYSDKTSSDYWIMYNGKPIPTASTILTDKEYHLFERDGQVAIYSDEFIEQLSPDNIDSREFWKKATDMFPLFSIAGGVETIKDVNQIHQLSLVMANALGALLPVEEVFTKNKNARLLEIGPGHGSFHQAINKLYGDKNYYAIDVNPLFEHERIFQTDGKTIPDTIPYPMDIVYSINVFQHLSKKQRTSYYKQIFEVLKDGGIFVFGMFVITEQNKDWPCWGTRGKDGKVYCSFFRQLTEIDKYEDLISELKEIGFSIEHLSKIEDKEHYLSFKCTKL